MEENNQWKKGQWCYQLFQPQVNRMGRHFIVSFHIIKVDDEHHVTVLNPWNGHHLTFHTSLIMTQEEALKALEEAND